MNRLTRWIIAGAIVLLLVAGGMAAFLHLGTWLMVEDPLAPAHAIVVLSGSMPERALEAARIYRQNFAAEVWVSLPVGPAEELNSMHIAYVGESFYNQRVLIAQDVPADAIRVFEDPIADTEEEVAEIARDCRRDGAHKVIIVTSKAHTRRVRTIWRHLVGNDPQLIVRYTSEDSFDAAHWWRRTSDVLDVVREMMGILNAWLGFPVRPQAHD